MSAAQEVSAGRQAVDDAGLDRPSAELLEGLSRTAGVKPKPAEAKLDARAGTAEAAESARPEVRSPPRTTLPHCPPWFASSGKTGVASCTRNGHHPRQLRCPSNAPPRVTSSAATRLCGLQGEGEKTAQFVVWMAAGGRSKGKDRKFRGNQRIAVSVAEPDWHEFRWAVHHDMQGQRKELNMEDDWAVEKRLEVELRALKLPMWTEQEIRCATHRLRPVFWDLETSLSECLKCGGLVSARCSAECGGLDA